MTDTLTGGCLCGAVRFETGAPRIMLQCHCTDCQKVSGGAPAHLVGIPENNLKITRGAPKSFTVKGSSGENVTRYFCGDCGTPLHSRPEAFPGTLFVKAGAYDDSAFYASARAVWTASAPPWHQLPEGVPHEPRGSR